MDLSNPQQDEAERLVRELPLLIDRLHNEYNKFFAGAEKKPPVRLREQLDRGMDRLKGLLRQIHGAGLGFRAHNALAKFTSYKSMWDKKLAEREGSRG